MNNNWLITTPNGKQQEVEHLPYAVYCGTCEALVDVKARSGRLACHNCGAHVLNLAECSVLLTQHIGEQER